MKTIFISIAAYRDPQLVPTIEDCLAKAAHPERLRFGICWQHGPEEERLPWADDERFRILDVDWRDSRGACWARAEVMHLWRGEDFFLQLDSHHRFADRWDERVIDQWERTGSPKALLTTYATPFDPENPDAREHLPMQMNFDRFTEESIILFRPGELAGWRERSKPARARFLSAHFLFTIGDFVKDVPYDPDLYFIGEEITLAVRAFTHGYDLYHPAEMIVWHEYTREYRAHKHWTDHNHDKGVKVAWHERDRVSLDKVKGFLLNPYVGPFGLGSVRTFQEYEAYAGVNFRLRRSQEYTRRFEEPPNPPAPSNWADRIRTYSLDLVIEKSRLPGDVSDYHFWYVAVFDANGLEIHRQDIDRKDIPGMLQGESPTVTITRTFETEKVPASWTVWPVSESRGWLDRIDGPVFAENGPVTFVTALLDIGRASLGESFGRGFGEHYLPKFDQLLALDVPMVIYVAPEHEAFVWERRDPFNTRVVTLRASDLEKLPWFERVQAIRRDQGWLAQAGWLPESPQAALAHYNPLVLSKMRWLDEAARENPFNARALYWIDAGLTATVPDSLLGHEELPQRLVQATDGFLWVAYPHRAASEIHGFDRRALVTRAGVGGVDRVVRGGFFGGTPERIREVAGMYDDLLWTTLDAGEMGTEESLFTILAYRHPEQFSHYLVESNGLLAPFFESVVRGRAVERRSAPVIWKAPAPAPEASGPAFDRPEDIERGASTFMGLPMMQSRRAIFAFDELWRHLSAQGRTPARIIEIGSGMGGLSVQLHVFATAVGATFYTIDLYESTHRDALFVKYGVDHRRCDITHEFAWSAVARDVQQPGLTVLICDAGSKIDDVRRFAPYLKAGDLIMAHDYARSSMAFEREVRGRIWNWCEITDDDITREIAEHDLRPVLPEVLGEAAWMCKEKHGTRVRPAPRAQGESGTLALYVLTFNAPDQLQMWCESVVQQEPTLLTQTSPRILLNNSTDESTVAAYDALAGKYGFEQVRLGNIGILGGRSWCAHHFTERTNADFMVFFEDDMLLHTEQGVCRNGFPTIVPGLFDKAVDIVRNEPDLGYLKLSYTEFYGDHRQNWAYFNLDAARREQQFPEGHLTKVDAVKSYQSLAYMTGEIFYSNWPMVISRAASDLIFEDHNAARFEQSLMVRVLELQRQGRLKGGVLLASPINHNRVIHYPGERKES